MSKILEIQDAYTDLFPEGDTYFERIFEMGEDAYLDLFTKAVGEKKFVYIKRGAEQVDGGELMLLSSEESLKQVNKTLGKNNLEQEKALEKAAKTK